MLLLMSLFLAAPAAPLASEAKVAAFIAALPPSQHSHEPDPEIAEQRAEAAAKFPAHKIEVDRIFDAKEQCVAKAGSDEVDRSLRATAKLLSDAELDSLTAFYSGPDYTRFGELQDAGKAKPLTADQQAELASITARYPLEKFGKATLQVAGSFDGKDAFFAALGACDDARDAALAAFAPKK